MLTNEMMDVLFYIPKGKRNAIPRAELCASAGYGDRKTRDIIAQLREEGYMIVNNQRGGGYYITDDLNEIEKQYWQDRGRALSILKRLKHMRRTLKEAGRRIK